MPTNKHDLLFVCQYFYPEYVTSATLAYQLAVDLAKSNMDVDILCGYPVEYYHGVSVPYEEVVDGLDIYRVRSISTQRHSFLGRMINTLSFTLSAFKRLLSIRQYKLIIVFTTPPTLPFVPALANMFFGTKYILINYDVYPEIGMISKAIKPGSLMQKTFNFINRISYARASKLIALSGDMKEALEKKGVHSNKIAVIHNWYDPPKSQSLSTSNSKFASLRSKYKLIVLYAGNMGICQDMDTLMRAAQALKSKENILFAFCGHGVKYPCIKETAAQFHMENCVFYDFLTGEDYWELQTTADLHVVSLAKGVEGFGVPSKTYSSLAAGKPILAIMEEHTDIVHDIKKYHAGFTVREGEDEKIVQYLLELLEKPELIQQMSRGSSRCFEENYTRQIITDKYRKIVSDCLYSEPLHT